jgi:hypothetical protein
MVADPSCNNFLLEESHKPLALRQHHARSCNIARITRAVDRYYVDASARPIDPGFRQTQNPLHP